MCGPDKKYSKYDLYAVSQHYGSMGGGHYTAICKNIDGNWYSETIATSDQMEESIQEALDNGDIPLKVKLYRMYGEKRSAGFELRDPSTEEETKASRGPGRREIGHGALAQRALEPVLPSVDEFPYAIRLVSEVLSSNGSTSQASICGSTLALMDAGVPIKSPVAGISCGLITEGDRWMTMVDIQGLEDFYGDMDFKVGGTHKGITAIQMDLKIDGLTPEIIKDAFAKTHKARDYILDEIILKAIPAPRPTVNKYAPKMMNMKVPTEKIRDVIGTGGKVIQKLCADFEVKIDIDEEGNVFICGSDLDKANACIDTIKSIVTDPEIGAIYKGKVVRVKEFGAFVEFAPGKEGMVHISELENRRVEKVEDVCNVGDQIIVKIIKIDNQGKIGLSRKAALADIEAKKNNK